MAAEDWIGEFDDGYDDDDPSRRRQRVDFTTWRTREGETVKIHAMTDAHLAAALRIVSEKWRPTHYRDEWVDVLTRETNRRKAEKMFEAARADPLFEIFAAGWAAHFAYTDPGWCAEPPSDPEIAFMQWRDRKGRAS